MQLYVYLYINRTSKLNAKIFDNKKRRKADSGLDSRQNAAAIK